MGKLTKAQIETLKELERFGGGGTHFAGYYPPIRKLEAMGLAVKREMRFGDHFVITEAGRAALKSGAPDA